MRKPNRVVLALAAAVAVASPALAGGKGLTPSSTPPGFGSAGGHNGFEFVHQFEYDQRNDDNAHQFAGWMG